MIANKKFTSSASIERSILPDFVPTIGFIGSGRMATALARGCVESGLVKTSQVLAADPHAEARLAFAEQVPGVEAFDSNEPILTRADIVVLAVKPQIMANVLVEIEPHVTERHLLVSIAAGITLARLAESLQEGTRLIRVMPNTPCLVGLGASCFSRGGSATDVDAEHVRQILASVGQAFEVPEVLLDAVTGLSGSGPAFIYRVIESLAEGGTAMGLPAELALQLAGQTARGAAEMVLTTGCSPAELREQVTSPGGTTLAGLNELARLQGAEAFRAAVVAATKRSQELGRG
jgi:pyrroline-5-carboxylate reductase